jgi:hypothetical protein
MNFCFPLKSGPSLHVLMISAVDPLQPSIIRLPAEDIPCSLKAMRRTLGAHTDHSGIVGHAIYAQLQYPDAIHDTAFAHTFSACVGSELYAC